MTDKELLAEFNRRFVVYDLGPDENNLGTRLVMIAAKDNAHFRSVTRIAPPPTVQA